MRPEHAIRQALIEKLMRPRRLRGCWSQERLEMTKNIFLGLVFGDKSLLTHYFWLIPTWPCRRSGDGYQSVSRHYSSCSPSPNIDCEKSLSLMMEFVQWFTTKCLGDIYVQEEMWPIYWRWNSMHFYRPPPPCEKSMVNKNFERLQHFQQHHYDNEKRHLFPNCSALDDDTFVLGDGTKGQGSITWTLYCHERRHWSRFSTRRQFYASQVFQRHGSYWIPSWRFGADQQSHHVRFASFIKVNWLSYNPHFV